MAKKKRPQRGRTEDSPNLNHDVVAAQVSDLVEAVESPETLAIKQELFCQCYAKNRELFGNATLSYAEAFEYKLELLDGDDYRKQYSVCATMSSRLLKKDEIQARIVVLLNELLKDDIVDSELAKIIQQDADLPSKIRAINEFNKIRGRILDRTRIEHERFDVDDIRAILSVLPQERQDQVYATITAAIAEAELLRSSTQVQTSSTQ